MQILLFCFVAAMKYCTCLVYNSSSTNPVDFRVSRVTVIKPKCRLKSRNSNKLILTLMDFRPFVFGFFGGGGFVISDYILDIWLSYCMRIMKKRSERRKHCALAVERNQKFSPCRRPSSRGRRTAKI